MLSYECTVAITVSNSGTKLANVVKNCVKACNQIVLTKMWLRILCDVLTNPVIIRIVKQIME